jgi:heme/copper-type cytochrome/quinol oxidase subunit 1
MCGLPFLNNFSFWMTASGAILVMISLFVGEFGQTAGWRIRRCRAFNTVRVGVDYYIWALQLAGWASLLSSTTGHHHQDARTRHGHDEDADLHLDRAAPTS